MAYPAARSSNRELEQGSVDGKYKQVIKDRGGVVEQTTWRARDDLSCVYYGIHEAPVMDTPDGMTCVSPYHTATPSHDEHALASVMNYG